MISWMIDDIEAYNAEYECKQEQAWRMKPKDFNADVKQYEQTKKEVIDDEWKDVWSTMNKATSPQTDTNQSKQWRLK